jgi:hypothetical protein
MANNGGEHRLHGHAVLEAGRGKPNSPVARIPALAPYLSARKIKLITRKCASLLSPGVRSSVGKLDGGGPLRNSGRPHATVLSPINARPALARLTHCGAHA